jgi:hypothetical protein
MANPIQHEKLPGGAAGKIDNPMFHSQQEGGAPNYQTATVKSELDHRPPTCGPQIRIMPSAVTFVNYIYIHVFIYFKKIHNNFVGLGTPLFTGVARSPAYNDGCGSIKKMLDTPELDIEARERRVKHSKRIGYSIYCQI